MSVQRWTWNQVGEAGPKAAIYILYADHARIVAEAVAEVTDALMASKREALAEMEQAHAAALAEERQRVLSMRFTEFMAAIKKSCPCICHEYTRDINPHDGKCVCNGGDGMETLGVAAPRTLTADDPEPAVGSVVLDGNGDAWQRMGSKWFCDGMPACAWRRLFISGPVTLIHDGGAA